MKSDSIYSQSEEYNLIPIKKKLIIIKPFAVLLFVLFLLLANLGCEDSSVEPNRVRLSAHPGIPTTAARSGRIHLSLDYSRNGFLYIPEGYSVNKEYPLMVLFHGAGGSSDNWSDYTYWADKHDMVLLVMESRESTWDSLNEGFGPDVKYLDDALAFTFERCRIDPARLAMAGFSDGASYTLTLGSANGDLFSHLIAYSPGYFYTPIDPVGSPKIFVSHGTDDTVLSFAKCEKGIVPHLQSLGYDVHFEKFIGRHEIPVKIARLSIEEWFLQID